MKLQASQGNSDAIESMLPRYCVTVSIASSATALKTFSRSLFQPDHCPRRLSSIRRHGFTRLNAYAIGSSGTRNAGASDLFVGSDDPTAALLNKDFQVMSDVIFLGVILVSFAAFFGID